MPKKQNKLFKNLIAGIAISFGVTAIASALSFLNPLHSWHLNISNNLYAESKPSDEILIIALDNQDDSNLDSAGTSRYTDRNPVLHKQVIENLENADAKSIAWDLVLKNPSKGISKETIDKLSKSVFNLSEQEAQTLINQTIYSYFEEIHPDDKALAESLSKHDNIILAAVAGNNNSPDQLPYKEFITQSGNELGYANSKQDADGLIRHVPISINNNDSLALKTAQHFTNNQIDTSGIPLEDGYMLINFFGKPYTFNHISYIDVANNTFDPNLVKDKIVLIGITSELIGQDHQLTPIDPDKAMPGVEIHANAIQTILEENYLQNQTLTSQILTIAILTLIASIILVFVGIWTGIGTTIILAIGYYFFARMSFANGTILNMIYPFIALALTYLASLAYKYFTELKAKNYIQGAFSRYLSPQIMQEVLKNPEMLHRNGVKRKVTVFFSDIEGFTTISEKLPPEQLIPLLNQYLATMTEIIMDHGGTLDKYVGDAIVAYFGSPVEQDDHAKRACDAALKMREILPSLQEAWDKQGLPKVDFRIGINTGEVIVGNIGSKNRFDYTVMGDEVNLGSRLEGANKKYETHVMISQTTYEEVKENFAARKLDLLKVKGKENPVAVYELLTRVGELSQSGQDLLSLYTEGINHYFNKNFKQAYETFKKLADLYPQDGPSKLYLQRCDVLSNFPPPDNWDGIFTMKTK